MINQITSYDEYVSAMSAEVEELLKQVNDGYRQDAELLAKRFTMESYKLLNATTEMDVARAKANLRHIKAKPNAYWCNDRVRPYRQVNSDNGRCSKHCHKGSH